MNGPDIKAEQARSGLASAEALLASIDGRKLPVVAEMLRSALADAIAHGRLLLAEHDFASAAEAEEAEETGWSQPAPGTCPCCDGPSAAGAICADCSGTCDQVRDRIAAEFGAAARREETQRRIEAEERRLDGVLGWYRDEMRGLAATLARVPDLPVPVPCLPLRARSPELMCGAEDGDFRCTAVQGHQPLDHAAWDEDGTLLASWPVTVPFSGLTAAGCISDAGAPRSCQCPEENGMVRHQRGTCTDPVVIRLGWYYRPPGERTQQAAPRPDLPLPAVVNGEVTGRPACSCTPERCDPWCEACAPFDECLIPLAGTPADIPAVAYDGNLCGLANPDDLDRVCTAPDGHPEPNHATHGAQGRVVTSWPVKAGPPVHWLNEDNDRPQGIACGLPDTPLASRDQFIANGDPAKVTCRACLSIIRGWAKPVGNSGEEPHATPVCWHQGDHETPWDCGKRGLPADAPVQQCGAENHGLTCTAISTHPPLDHVGHDTEGIVVGHWKAEPQPQPAWFTDVAAAADPLAIPANRIGGETP